MVEKAWRKKKCDSSRYPRRSRDFGLSVRKSHVFVYDFNNKNVLNTYREKYEKRNFFFFKFNAAAILFTFATSLRSIHESQ